WTVPPGRVKQLRGKVRKDGEEVPPYIVPLSRQAIEEVRGLLQKTGKYPFAFAGRNDPTKMMSENTINKALRLVGYGGRQTGHGFRHLLSTELNSRGYNRDWIERQIAH
ncbi:tyrosine-type recombinase/integrase, partial [Pseudomonas aeruginosa]|nr:tyrosine-type recombinase/integrase [Pseudomonas aeruginosa]